VKSPQPRFFAWRGLVAESPTQAVTKVEAGSCPNKKELLF